MAIHTPDRMDAFVLDSVQRTLEFTDYTKIKKRPGRGGEGVKGLILSAIDQFSGDQELMAIMASKVTEIFDPEYASWFFNPEKKAQLEAAEVENERIRVEHNTSCGCVGWEDHMAPALHRVAPDLPLHLYRQMHYSNQNQTWPLVSAINSYFQERKENMQTEALRYAVDDTEIAYFREMLERFVARDDVIRPFEGEHEWNIHRSFPIIINGIQYDATLVVSPDSGWKASFQLEQDRVPGKKGGGGMKLGQTAGEKQYSPKSIDDLNGEFLRCLYEMAEKKVDDFYRMLEKQASMSQKYSKINLFGVLLKLEMGELDKEDFRNDPAAAFALEIDLWDFRSFNSSLNAAEYAVAVCKDQDELRDLILERDKAKFMLYIVKGYMRLCKAILAEGAGGEPNLLDGLDDEQRMLVKFGNWGNGSVENKESQTTPITGDVQASIAQVTATIQ